MQDQQGSEMQSEGDANVTIIEPEEGEAETTVIEPEAEGEEAETTVIEPETEGEATETMAAGTASAEELMGMSVVGSDGEELGEISD
ncbi:MAG TPA: hypothetical protein VK943_14585, partial [Arenibaculum sp.]|nr:hypothetical protein [Arenibaculum sp.]